MTDQTGIGCCKRLTRSRIVVLAMAMGCCAAFICRAATSPAVAFGAGGLPDGRAYEQATPAEKDGATPTGFASLVQAAAQGGAVSFFSQAGFPGAEGAQDLGMFVSRRGTDAWSTEGLLPTASAGPVAQVLGWDPELENDYVMSGPIGSSANSLLQRRIGSGSLQSIVAAVNAPNLVASAEAGTRVVFEATQKLGATPGIEGKSNVYVWSRPTGSLSLVSVFNDGTSPPEGAFAGPYNWFRLSGDTSTGGAAEGYYLQEEHAVSEFGDGVYFTSAGNGQLYLRENPSQSQSATAGESCSDLNLACTVHVSASQKTNGQGEGGTDSNGPLPAAFQQASADGSRALFTSSEELTNDANTGPDPTVAPVTAIGRAELDGGGAEDEFLPATATAVAVDADHVYWADATSDAIGRANIDGSEVEPEWITGVDNPQGIAIGAGHVYWTNAGGEANGEGTIGRANVNGSEVEGDWITGANNPRGIAVDPEHVFWANQGGTLSTRQIARANIDGTGVDQSFVRVSGRGNPDGIAIDSSFIYYSRPATGAIGRAKIDGTENDQALISGLADPTGLAVDGSHLFWASGTGNAIGRAAVDGTGIETAFIPAISGPRAVAIDAAHVYWASVYEKHANPGNDLYRYSSSTGELVDLSPDPGDANGAEVKGVLGASDDLSYVYFVANGALASGASIGNCNGQANGVLGSIEGSCNLYLWHDGTTAFVSSLEFTGNGWEDSDAANILPTLRTAPSALEKTSRVSADGRTLVFRSHLQLTGYDSRSAACVTSTNPEGRCPEFYRFRVGEPGVTCLTCDPTGAAAPVGPPSLQSIEPGSRGASTPAAITTRNLSSTGNRFFFETPDRLVRSDTNGFGGCPSGGNGSALRCQDVYEWEAPGEGTCTAASAAWAASVGGCLFLISTGVSPEPSYFGDASGDGNDAFFFTQQPLVGQDTDRLTDIYDARVGGGLPSQNPAPKSRCFGEGCRGAPQTAPGGQTAGSANFSGSGNQKPLRCKKSKRRAVRHGREVCIKRRHHRKHRHHHRKHRHQRGTKGGGAAPRSDHRNAGGQS